MVVIENFGLTIQAPSNKNDKGVGVQPGLILWISDELHL